MDLRRALGWLLAPLRRVRRLVPAWAGDTTPRASGSAAQLQPWLERLGIVALPGTSTEASLRRNDALAAAVGATAFDYRPRPVESRVTPPGWNFGLEIEFIATAGVQATASAVQAGSHLSIEAVPVRFPEAAASTGWSVTEETPEILELISPMLMETEAAEAAQPDAARDSAGQAEQPWAAVDAVLAGLEATGATIDPRCGLHVHGDARQLLARGDVDALRRIARLVRWCQPLLYRWACEGVHRGVHTEYELFTPLEPSDLADAQTRQEIAVAHGADKHEAVSFAGLRDRSDRRPPQGSIEFRLFDPTFDRARLQFFVALTSWIVTRVPALADDDIPDEFNALGRHFRADDPEASPDLMLRTFIDVLHLTPDEAVTAWHWYAHSAWQPDVFDASAARLMARERGMTLEGALDVIRAHPELGGTLASRAATVVHRLAEMHSRLGTDPDPLVSPATRDDAMRIARRSGTLLRTLVSQVEQTGAPGAARHRLGLVTLHTLIALEELVGVPPRDVWQLTVATSVARTRLLEADRTLNAWRSSTPSHSAPTHYAMVALLEPPASSGNPAPHRPGVMPSAFANTVRPPIRPLR